jgi:hypothetical protein
MKRWCSASESEYLESARAAEANTMPSCRSAAASRSGPRRTLSDSRIYPALNTKFMGAPVQQGVWEERCLGCGNCVLDSTGGIAPSLAAPNT